MMQAARSVSEGADVQFLLLLLPFWGLELIIIPALLWVILPSHWHPLLVLIYALCGLLIVAIWLRGVMRDAAEAKANPATQASWRWPDRISSDKFRTQLSLFLQLRGWRVLSSTIGEGERVEMIAQKDRWCVALMCVGPQQPAASAKDLSRLDSLRRTAGASHVALITSEPRGSAMISSTAATNVLLLRFDDLARFDDALGLRL
jgi:hypothetical protein